MAAERGAELFDHDSQSVQDFGDFLWPGLRMLLGTATMSAMRLGSKSRSFFRLA